jgi:hypothetical protein
MRHEAASEDELGGIPDDESWDERRRAFFSTRGTVRPSPELLGHIDRLVAEPRNDCLLVGPSGAGKTALLSSFSQACAVAGSADLALLPHEELAALAGEAEAYRFGGRKWRPTVETTTYALQLRAGSKDFFLKVQDGPGGLLFPFFPARWDALPNVERHAYEAACLVLCIDATNPRPDLWRASLPPLLTRLATSSGSLIPRITAPPRDRGADFPRLLTPSRQLPYERVLVALTRIDGLVQEALRVFEAGHRHARGRVPQRLSPIELALQIDPFRLLEDRVGAILGLLRAALAPHAELAIGLTSAWGLNELHGPWSPFGVREALHFLTDGVCREPVVRVDLNALVPGDEERWTEIPPSPRRP